MPDSNLIGRQLEDAVRRIEETIIESDPVLKAAGFEIRTREKIRIKGVSHEIDVVVWVNKNTAYSSLHIFECKNWRKPIGKNEVILFAETIAASGAAKGYLVGKKFTKGAEAQALQYAQLRLVHCSSDFRSPLDLLRPVATTSDFLSLVLSVKQRGVPPQDPPNWLPKEGVICRHAGGVKSLKAFALAVATEGLREHLGKGGAWPMMEGTRAQRVIRKLEFDENEFWIGDKEIEYMVLDATFLIHSRLPVVTSKYQIEGRGRVYSYESPATQGLPSIKIELVQKQGYR